MIDALILISQRHIVISLAIIGALLVTAGSLVAKPRGRNMPEPAGDDARGVLARRLTTVGYVVTMTSIALFIVAGFVSDLRP
ncbi:MAG: hypothetical protein APF80_08860 [Alphaproteobacteria bacterium BRH_c36]|nr:MAG: hypothetical protein APF80_08860 [Alphaproteobacteria bacterium BRH_c36]